MRRVNNYMTHNGKRDKTMTRAEQWNRDTQIEQMAA